ncbi:MAG: ABC transporter ATP-binding protein [Mesorhizobium sp.]|uniref:ABC transporter ATP-binding protein n=1 Tax=Mesorhizobium sp. TaxID=1871066 RepID=UPI0012027214|nr:ABC transporter ATP-binding protein [Mesorhizobium sp.]TIR48681.1 MAG: ABC transporter ATP-binding protein [Mesorhizobium sp.]
MTETILHASKIAIEIAGLELVSDVDLEVDKGHSLGIVGETGSGKSLTCRALAGLLSPIGGRISRGNLRLGRHDVTSPGAHGKENLYGRVVSLVPQNSLTALNPLMRIGTHLTETIKALNSGRIVQAKARAIDLLERVGLPNPERILSQYPHELSGGMRQRVMIALAIAGRPQLLIADEPTTALDVSVQKDILELLRRLSHEENMALILVSHDLGVIATATQAVAVMYAGRIVERGPTDTVLRQPRHPYTQALLRARPTIGRTGRLIGILGAPASPEAWPIGCRFASRCPHVESRCKAKVPALEKTGAEKVVACHRVKEHLALELE